jgi:hypothetical protein
VPPTRGEIRRFVQAALRARDRVSALEDGVLEKVLEDLRAARRGLLEDLAGGRGTSFSTAYKADLLQSVDRAARGIETSLREEMVPRVGDVAKAADDLLVANFRIAGLDRDVVPMQAFVSTRALALAQGDYVGALVQKVGNETRDRIGTELRRALAGQVSLEQFEKTTLAAVGDPGPFGTAAVRAEVIVRTEYGRTLEMSGQVHRKSLGEAGLRVVKRWIAVRDFRTRPSHRILHGVEKAPEEYFDVGGEPALFPMDPALSAEESINCRCTCVNRVIPPGKE